MPAILDQLVNGLVGAAFGIRAFDGRRPFWARVAYGAVGFDLLRAAYYGEPVLQPAAVGDAKVVRGGSHEVLGRGPTVPLTFEKVKLRSTDIAERVAYVHKQAVAGAHDPSVYSLARAVVSRKCGGEWCIKERDHVGEATALFNEVRSRCRYTLDPLFYDAFQTPNKTLQLKTGDCDDQTSLLAAMLITIGLQVETVVVQTTGYSTFNHIYLRTKIPNKGWMSLDPTVAQPAGWEVPANAVTARRTFKVAEKGVPKLS